MNLSGQKCAATLESPFYGENGAIKCLNEGSGQFAFVDLKVAKNSKSKFHTL